MNPFHENKYGLQRLWRWWTQKLEKLDFYMKNNNFNIQ